MSLSVAATRPSPRPMATLHAVLLGFPLPLFLGAFVTDFAYRATFHVQWANFAAWLIAGGLVFGAFLLLWAAVALLGGHRSGRERLALYFVVLLLMWGVGFANALIHARDAWATMPEGLYLSALSVFLAFVAVWIGYSRAGVGR